MFLRHSLVFIFLAASSFYTNAQEEYNAEKIKAKIQFEKAEELLRITGIVVNGSDVDLAFDYEMNVKKVTGNNFSNNKQSGKVMVKSNDITELSTTAINHTTGETIEVTLTLYVDTKMVHSEIVTYPPKKSNTTLDSTSQTKKAPIALQFDDGVILRGVVIDETLTKMGKDFYDYFFSYYNLVYRNSPFRVLIEEKPMFGRITQVIISVDDEQIFAAPTNPRQEYLEELAKYTVQLAGEYIRKHQY